MGRKGYLVSNGGNEQGRTNAIHVHLCSQPRSLAPSYPGISSRRDGHQASFRVSPLLYLNDFSVTTVISKPLCSTPSGASLHMRISLQNMFLAYNSLTAQTDKTNAPSLMGIAQRVHIEHLLGLFLYL